MILNHWDQLHSCIKLNLFKNSHILSLICLNYPCSTMWLCLSTNCLNFRAGVNADISLPQAPPLDLNSSSICEISFSEIYSHGKITMFKTVLPRVENFHNTKSLFCQCFSKFSYSYTKHIRQLEISIFNLRVNCLSYWYRWLLMLAHIHSWWIMESSMCNKQDQKQR